MFKEFVRDISALGGLPVYFLAVIVFVFKQRYEYALSLIISFILVYALVVPIRLVYFRRRPDKQRHKGILSRIDASSFPSIHAARAAILGITLIYLFNNILFTIFAAIVILLAAWTRVWLKRHYASDVAVGLVLGAAAALAAVNWIAPYLFNFLI